MQLGSYLFAIEPFSLTVSLTSYPPQQIAALEAAYNASIARKRVRFLDRARGLCRTAVDRAVSAPRLRRRRWSRRSAISSAISTAFCNLDSGARVWTDPAEWFWGWKGWLKLLAETLLLSYVGTTIGAIGALCLNFFAATNTSRRTRCCASSRAASSNSAVPFPSIVFALIFVIAFGLGPMAGVLAIAIHSHRRARQALLRDRREYRHEAAGGRALDWRQLAVVHPLSRSCRR